MSEKSMKSGTLSSLDKNLLQSAFVPIERNSSSDMGTRLMEESCMNEKNCYQAPLTTQL